MKNNKSLFVYCLLLIFSTTATRAQSYSGGNYPNYSITLRSDYPSKSVLVTDLFKDRFGDQSPIIGAANWTDSGRQLQCRSLLKFNYIFLPGMIVNDPSLITSAELILYPVLVGAVQNDQATPTKFYVRRVLENWEDTATMWMNQPPADSIMQVKEVMKKKQKNKPVSIDVTGLVMDMLRYGNNGFMICHDNTSELPMTSGHWFASPKNEDETIRPLLVIHYRSNWLPPVNGRSLFSAEDIVREMDMKIMKQNLPGTNGPVMEPVREPVTEPVKTNPVKD
ncbi:MAG: DNRLRE domain-containing protein [Chitinophagaceae bacterium]|nr:DNRLRE domain-containing protein [Chitinophagaceae bacterium]